VRRIESAPKEPVDLVDAAGVPVALTVLAAVVLATLPLALLLRPAVEGKPTHVA